VLITTSPALLAVTDRVVVVRDGKVHTGGTGHRALGEHLPRGDPQAGRAGPADQSHGHDAVAAEREEVRLDVDAGQAQGGRNDLAQRPFAVVRGLAARPLAVAASAG